MWVKICGNTRLEDCLRAHELGADAVGFVFARGKRTVTAAEVAEITKHLPATLEKIGVFTSRDAEEIARTATAAGLTGVQLHGPLDRGLLDALLESSFIGRTIQVLHWRTDLSAEAQGEGFSAQIRSINDWDPVDAVLVDSQTAVAAGGTGIPFDWAAVAPLIRRSRPPVVAAGGLRPENVAEAVQTLRPWGVDVSSGVEEAPGVKSAAKMGDFIRNAQTAFLREHL
jgi:phosphoribosylanthranilate isomerase